MSQHGKISDTWAIVTFCLLVFTYVFTLLNHAFVDDIRDDVRAICGAVGCVEEDTTYREQVIQ